MKIAFDLDDVLAQFVASFIKFHNRVYRTNLEYNDVFSYVFSEVLGGTSEDVIEKVRAFRLAPEFPLMQPVTDAVETVKSLAASNDLIIITSREVTMKEESLRWLQSYFPGCFEEVFFTSDFYSEQGDKLKKADVCRMQNVDIMVDDSATFANECSAYCKRTFLVNRPWNQNAVCNENVTRIDSIAEVSAYLTV